jgi:hypothetical protein
MRTLQYAAAIAFGLSSGLLASVASAQDSATLKPFRDKSMIKIEYKAPTDKTLEPIYQRLKAREVLERMQAFLSPLRLPQPLNLVTAQCGGQVELPYQPDAPVTICYEYVALIEQEAPAGLGFVGQAFVTHDIALVGPFVQFTLRSIARHIIDMLELPVWGNAEDAADNLAAFIMLEVSPQVAQKTIFGTAYFFAKTMQSAHLSRSAISTCCASPSAAISSDTPCLCRLIARRVPSTCRRTATVFACNCPPPSAASTTRSNMRSTS